MSKLATLADLDFNSACIKCAGGCCKSPLRQEGGDRVHASIFETSLTRLKLSIHGLINSYEESFQKKISVKGIVVTTEVHSTSMSVYYTIYFDCQELSETGSCLDYHNRPQSCRNFICDSASGSKYTNLQVKVLENNAKMAEINWQGLPKDTKSVIKLIRNKAHSAWGDF